MDHARIHLQILTQHDQLTFIIHNDIHPVPEKSENRIKIGLKNVIKRLQILYPEKHSLQFGEANGIFSVTMNIMLDKQKPNPKTEKSKKNPLIPVYA
jgi:LytS/YehU family sensor histidine kinase